MWNVGQSDGLGVRQGEEDEIAGGREKERLRKKKRKVSWQKEENPALGTHYLSRSGVACPNHLMVPPRERTEPVQSSWGSSLGNPCKEPLGSVCVHCH